MHVLDVWGLGTPEVAEAVRARRLRGLFPELFRKHGVRYAAVNDEWYDLRALSPGMRVVARLAMECPRVICSGDKVALCVTDERDAKRFEQYLREFARKLPSGVRLEFQTDQDVQANL